MRLLHLYSLTCIEHILCYLAMLCIREKESRNTHLIVVKVLIMYIYEILSNGRKRECSEHDESLNYLRKSLLIRWTIWSEIDSLSLFEKLFDMRPDC